MPTPGDPPEEKTSYKLPLKPIIVPLKDLVVFPTMIVSVYVRNPDLIKALEESFKKHELIGMVTQKSGKKPVPPTDNLYEIGSSATILQIIHGTKLGDAMVVVEAISRFKVKKYVQERPYLIANIEPVSAREKDNVKLLALAREVKELMRFAVSEGRQAAPEIVAGLNTIQNTDEMADVASSFLKINIQQKQELLSEIDPEKRLKMILDYLNNEIQLLKIKKKIHTDISQELNENEKKYMLRQELKAIKKELGEDEPSAFGMEGMTDPQDIKDLTKMVKDSKMPPAASEIAKKELERLTKIIPISPEYTVARTYIEWLCDMPWNKSCPVKVDVKKARKILDEDHYGLEKIKERILEFLSVCQLNETCGATILCFVGPPGVGKTSLGKSIARALGRSFVHSSLGGMHDEADIRGHRRTYVGALPGRIIQGLKRAGCNDAVFMLDEIDKVGKDFQGDPASALLEVLDPEQNNEFTDHYLDVPFDLSKVFFILTANVLDTVPPALADRMEIIELPGYTEEEKLEIAKKYLIPRQLKGNGLENHPFKLTDAAILYIVRKYTYEAGLRELERKIGAVCRKIAKDLIEKKKKVAKVDVKDVEGYLGTDIYDYDVKQEEDMVGVSTGLAWTPYGGDIIFVESTRMPGDKNLILTGNLGEVMQESARAALSYVRSNADQFDIDSKKFEKSDIHIHVPEGATPKDGPSAGITICTSLISLLTGLKVRRDVAMTGEVTLTGRILPIGGLKEKILAAKRALIKTIIIPEKNKKDLKEIPVQILKDVSIKFAKTLDDVVKVAIIGKVGKGAAKHKIPKLKVKIIRKEPVPENK